MATCYKVCKTDRPLWLPITRYAKRLGHYRFPCTKYARRLYQLSLPITRYANGPTIASHYKVCKRLDQLSLPITGYENGPPNTSHYKECKRLNQLSLPITRYEKLLDQLWLPITRHAKCQTTMASHYKVCKTCQTNYGYPVPITRHAELADHNAKLQIAKCAELGCHYDFSMTIRLLYSS